MKLCTKCGELKPLTEFYKDKSRYDGVYLYCKSCERVRREQSKEQFLTAGPAKTDGVQVCTKCKTSKPLPEFPPDNRGINGGYQRKCREFYRLDSKTRREKTRQRNGVEIPDTFVCRKCGTSKLISEFGVRRYSSRGHDTKCRECVSSVARARYRRNANQITARQRSYAKTPTGRAAIQRYWRSDKGKLNSSRTVHRRRSRITASDTPTLTVEQWHGVLGDQGYHCALCTRAFSDDLPPTVDHIVPVAKGGNLSVDNVQALCRSCNSKKNASDWSDVSNLFDYELKR
jgi:5-methylcytosine-specific restriction endonuclease McrA